MRAFVFPDLGQNGEEVITTCSHGPIQGNVFIQGRLSCVINEAGLQGGEEEMPLQSRRPVTRSATAPADFQLDNFASRHGICHLRHEKAILQERLLELELPFDLALRLEEDLALAFLLFIRI
ncbi:hypothetical protein AVEN_99949-1 [Araneus ventricosus]|uniref:Uncharacterized protein n=1 Tax=Araneus ventricosus TaxID=182803 RepID=A0A4Y2FEV0_ARAVE|nr:hypothetical protein AVEN_99949-1 [Araneus ventricosus]